MATDRRSHPTVRPHALALGVLERPGATARLSFLGASLAAELGDAMMLDTLGCLSTFPVRHRYVFEADGAPLAKLPATWKLHPLPTGVAPARAAFAHLFSLGCEASLLVATDGPVLPLGELFDGLLALASPGSGSTILVGKAETGVVYAIGLAKDHASITDAIQWSNVALEEAVEAAAHDRGLTVKATTVGYVVDSPEGLRRLAKDVEAGAFAPNCRKLFERPELKRLIA